MCLFIHPTCDIDFGLYADDNWRTTSKLEASAGAVRPTSSL